MSLKNNFTLALGVFATLNLLSCKKDKETKKTEELACTNNAFNYVKDGRLLALPTAISPNGDGRNDFFGPITNMSPDSFSVQVSDPSGKVVYTYSPADRRWDGAGKESYYQYYVTIKVTGPDGVTSSCAPLFVLQSEEGKCIHNAKADDRKRYSFPDQYHLEYHQFNLKTMECYQGE